MSEFKLIQVLPDPVNTTTVSESVDMSEQTGYAFHVTATNTTPSAVVFAPADITVASDTIEAVDHGLITGDVGQITTATTLPDGLAATTDYYVVKVDDDNFQLASSYANAVAGTAIDIIDQGTGNHTFTPTALGGASIKLQHYNGNAWEDISGSSNNITATASFTETGSDFVYGSLRAVCTITSGRLNLSAKINAK